MNNASPTFLEDPQKLRTIFLTVAAAEAFSWLGLLTGMYFKYVTESTEVGVQIFGPIHGAIFIAYVMLAIFASRLFAWSRTTLIWALVASIPPFCTVIFEVIAERRGLLRQRSQTA